MRYLLICLLLTGCAGSFAWEDPINETDRENYWKKQIADLQNERVYETDPKIIKEIDEQIAADKQEL